MLMFGGGKIKAADLSKMAYAMIDQLNSAPVQP